MLSNNASLVYGILINAGPRTVAELKARTGLSQPVLSRALNDIAQHSGRLLTQRQGRSILYAISRAIRSLPLALAIYQVQRNGAAAQLGSLIALEGRGYVFVAANGRSELFAGLPWFLQDMRPQGYIGRAFRDAYAQDLGLSNNLALWSDDDVIYALSQFGEDAPGNLIIGDHALRRFLAADVSTHLPLHSQAEHYDRMAELAVQGVAPGSSAGGEHPKFLLHDGTSAAIVKFSPLLDGSAAATRWKDLLIAEHLASQALKKCGIAVPDTRIVLSEKRCYLQSARFDRVGAKGRIAAASFDAIDNGFIGAHQNWSASAGKLRALGLITAECEAQVKLVEWFGRCIANTDMHFGNLSFLWNKADEHIQLNLAPIYDMLPMLYAPEKSEVVTRSFVVPQGGGMALAKDAALAFWQELAANPAVSDLFRSIAAENSKLLGK